jgi:N-acetylglucosaminyldiphosphoundecaprenol N-acetyl-beta-D-mannosaminyltransferase
MIDIGKKNLLGVSIDAVDYDAAVKRIMGATLRREAYSVAALAVHGVMTGVLDPEHRFRLNSFDLVVPDGQPVRWGLNLVHCTQLADRVYGPTLMLRICEAAARAGVSVFLYGSRPEVVARLAENLPYKVPGLVVAGAKPTLFRQIAAAEREEIVRSIRATGAGLLFVGLGCPRQEVWVYEFGPTLAIPVIAVGAAFDFHAGVLRQAPASLQRGGLEWVYRLAKEPTRLWRRYLVLNPLYLALLTLQVLGMRRFAGMGRPPERELLYG